MLNLIAGSEVIDNHIKFIESYFYDVFHTTAFIEL